MNDIEIKLFSQTQYCNIGFESVNSLEFLSIFPHRIKYVDGRLKFVIEILQVYSEELKTNLITYVSRYKRQKPFLNKLSTFGNNLKTGEYFYILPNTKLDTIEFEELLNRLKALNEGVCLEKLQYEFELQSGGFWNYYNRSIFSGNEKAYVGVAKKAIRKCRFCGKGLPEVTFNNKSHAISEALGNKTVFCREECDSCNSNFGNGIEAHLIAYFNLHRTFFGILGKSNNSPKHKGRNYSMELDESNKIQIEVMAEDIESVIDTGLITNDYTIKQNIYRALCKYVTSVIDSDQLSALKKCIEWINGRITLDRLPPIWTTTVNENNTEFARLAVYIRKNSDVELSHVVGNLRFTNSVYIFILPCSAEDELCFVEPDERKKFGDFIYKQNKNTNWKEQDFSSSQRERLTITVKKSICKLDGRD